MAAKRRPPHNPHDRFFRSAMENRAIARGFMHYYLPEPIRNSLDLDSLSLEHDSYLDSALQQKQMGLVARVLKHIRNDELGPLLLEWLEEAHALGLDSPQWADFLKSLIHYVLSSGNIAEPENLLAERHRLPPPIGDTLMTFAEHMEAKGKAEALKLTATNLLREGVDPAVVARGTGLSLAVVKQLEAEIHVKSNRQIVSLPCF